MKDHLTNDVAMQIHDLDGDGKNRSHLLQRSGADRRRRRNRKDPLQDANAAGDPRSAERAEIPGSWAIHLRLLICAEAGVPIT